MKIVINACFGGFGLSEAAYKEMGMEWDGFGFAHGIKRNDPKLVAAVEKLGEEANGQCADLQIIEIPDDVDWEIQRYDGRERVTEKCRSWY